MADPVRPRCETAPWCALDPGHEGGCSIIRARGQLEAVTRAVEQAFDDLATAMAIFLARINLVAERTQKDYTLHPDPKENEDDRPDHP